MRACVLVCVCVEWMDDVIIYFNSILVISGQCLGDDERLCAMEPRFEIFWLLTGIELGTVRLAGQRLIH